VSATYALADDARTTAGVLLLTLVAVEWGGTFLLRVSTAGVPATDFQRGFYRAGHAHAGVLVVLGLVCQLLVSATDVDGLWRTIAATGVPAAAILMPLGFFVSAAGRDVERPSRLVLLVWLGAACLAAGVVALGVALLTG
jgi:hypothetical protein